MRAWTLTLLTLFLIAPVSIAQPTKTWHAGLAKVNITPTERMWMSGYASRKEPAKGKLHDLWAKALVLQDAKKNRIALVTLDLVGIPRDLSIEVCADLKKKFGLDRENVMLSTSHTHTGPVVGSNLNSMYFLDAKQQKLVNDYAMTLKKKIVEAVQIAMKDLKPAQVSWANGMATFAVNRRTNSERNVPQLRKEQKLKGPVDHQVPVLAIRDSEGKKLRGVVFGYACHATVLSFMQWSGDYPGFAQIEVEKAHPGTIAMFWAGCGGDQNPLPRRSVALAQKYGAELADAVNAVLKKKMKPLAASVWASYREIDLRFAPLPSRDKLVQDTMSTNRYVVARAKLLLEKLKEKGSLSGTYPYPIQVWHLGEKLNWVALGGEVVVDYALRIKKEVGSETTWVTAYANDVMAYVPSLRVLKEGGYEGGGAMVYYGLPTVWAPKVEEAILAEVHRQVPK